MQPLNLQLYHIALNSFSMSLFCKKRRVTILTAAGLNMPPNMGGISTGEITELVKKYPGIGNPQPLINGLPAGQYFFDVLVNHHKKSGTDDVGLNLVNFETLVFLVEELYAYYWDLRHGIQPDQKGFLPAILQLDPDLDKHIKNAAFNGVGGGESHNFLREVMRILVKPIIDRVALLDSDNSHSGMTEFSDKLLKEAFPDNRWYKRVYTLNYDTWINQRLEYWDGFDDGVFNTKKVMRSYDFNCHYNLHGSVRWRPHINEAGIEKLDSIVDIMGYGTSDQTDQGNHPLIKTPIITGYNKAARLTSMPYLALHHAFLTDILNSDYLIVVGYGGADPHVNKMLSLYKGKAAIVNYFSSWVDSKRNGDDVDIYDDWCRHFLEAIVEPHNGGWANEMRWGRDPFIKSNDGRLTFWWQGLNDEFYNQINNHF
jgi:hypothetical protein